MVMLSEETNATSVYTRTWAFDPSAEKEAFERFVRVVMERWERYPDLHIYYYAPYEPTAIKRLTGRHSTCVEEVDRMLRADLFIDLYHIFRQVSGHQLKAIPSRNLSHFTASRVRCL
jgi:uncharacterized protein